MSGFVVFFGFSFQITHFLEIVKNSEQSTDILVVYSEV